MSCARNAQKVGQTAATNTGISATGSQNSYTAGSTAQASPAVPTKATKRRSRRTARKQRGNVTKKAAAKKKVSRARKKETRPAKPSKRAKSLPTQRRITLTKTFKSEELQQVSLHLRLGSAAVARHIRTLHSGNERDIGFSDPRPLDWARQDQQNYQFLLKQLSQTRRDGGKIDTAPLKNSELVDLWEFAHFEADRAHRNLDHLFGGSSHLKGPTAKYLAKQHKLSARFFSFLAGQLDPLITPEMREAYMNG